MSKFEDTIRKQNKSIDVKRPWKRNGEVELKGCHIRNIFHIVKRSPYHGH